MSKLLYRVFFVSFCWQLVCLLPAQARELFPQVPATNKGGGASEISIKAQVLKLSYCHSDWETFSVRIIIKLRFINVSDRNVILSRKIETSGLVRVARTVDDAQKGNFEYNPDFHYAVAELPNSPRFGRHPDPKHFILLAPRESFETTVETGVIGAMETAFAAKLKAAIVPRGDHVLQLGVDTWPYHWPNFTPSSDSHELSRRWAAIGTLVTGTVITDFVPFTIPEEFKNPPCKN